MDDPSMSPLPHTFDDLIRRAQEDKNLSPGQSRNLASALRRFSEVDGRAGAMSCDANSVRGAIGRINPARHGIPPRTWSNILSQVRRACRSYGAANGKSYHDLLSPEWRLLRERIEVDQRLRLGLSRFISWANRTGCSPQDVNDRVLEDFHRHMEEVDLLPDARKRYRDTCGLWNRASSSIEDWPRQLVTVPNFSRNFSLEFDELPAGLTADLEEYCAIFGGERPFDRRSPNKPLRLSTLHATRHAIRRLASAAIRSGIPPEQLTSLASLIERRNLQPALIWYRERLGKDAPSLFEAVTKVVSIARHYLLKPEAELADLLRVSKRLNCRERGMTPKNLERLRPFAQPHYVTGFVHFGDRHRRDANASSIRQALAYQTALVHDLLLCAPMRFNNLIGLRIGQHLRIEQRGRGTTVRIQIPAAEVKNRVDLTFELPDRVAGHLARYIQDFRPRLVAEASNDFLFPDAGDGHLTSVAMADRLCKAIRRELGLEINPHLYRHIAAFIYLQQHPGEYETVRQLLGHKVLATTTTFYTVFESWMSQRAYHRILDQHLRPAAE
jgi:integrase